MQFKDVKKFFKSWGLYPLTEDAGELNSEVIGNGISEPVYEKMLKEAESLPQEEFITFVSHSLECNDGAYTVGDDTWDRLEESWEDFLAMVGQD